MSQSARSVEGVLDMPLYIHVDMVLNIKSFLLLKYILIQSNILAFILSLSTAGLIFNIATVLALKQIYKETVNKIK